MPNETPQSSRDSANAGSITIIFSGGHADVGAIELGDYAASLQGWYDFFRLTGEIYRRSCVGREGPDTGALRIEANAERPGSYEIKLWLALAAASGVVSGRADALAVWSYRKLVAWYKKLLATYLSSKRRNTNVDSIISALEEMVQKENVMLVIPAAPSNDNSVAIKDDEELEQDNQGSARLLVERLDHALLSATKPLDQECTKIDLIDTNGKPISSLAQNDREVLSTPLTLPPPEGIWHHLLVKFERINRKTGRALIYHESSEWRSTSASYAKIIDSDVHVAGNVYTEAFSADIPLKVWARQVRGEKGRLNLMWDITAKAPDQLSLFGPTGSRA